jgi:hypothetical protein
MACSERAKVDAIMSYRNKARVSLDGAGQIWAHARPEGAQRMRRCWSTLAVEQPVAADGAARRR